jgi:hypothetical protein
MYKTILIALVCLLLGSTQCIAQGFSYDGNRWYEIEVSIFTNQSLSDAYPELFLPDGASLRYPTPILQLKPLRQFYAIDFSAPGISGNLLNATEAVPKVTEPLIGPVYLAPNNSFRKVDKLRDAFIALDDSEHEFTQYNGNLELSPNHRLLYHAVWRQPVLNKVQASAIQIIGGDRFGAHSELEGSLTISYNINRVDIDAQLWRNVFNISSELDWHVPLPPLSDNTEADSPGLVISRVYPMLQTRQTISNQLHYLDHPAFGMLVEVRPYELPPLLDFSLD